MGIDLPQQKVQKGVFNFNNNNNNNNFNANDGRFAPCEWWKVSLFL
jgi:hypothetical protein